MACSDNPHENRAEKGDKLGFRSVISPAELRGGHNLRSCLGVESVSLLVFLPQRGERVGQHW